MKLSRKSEYALLAMVALAKRDPKLWVSIAEISSEQKISRKYLERILLRLKNAGCLESVKGKNGGYRLAKPAGKISAADVVRLMDGPIASVKSASRYFYEHTPIEKNKELSRLFREIRDTVSKKMEATTLESLVREKRGYEA